MSVKSGLLVLAMAGSPWAGQPKEVDDRGTGPWPVDVRGFVPVQPGEHPRLLFRKADIPRLREVAKTPEGQALIKRLRAQLNGSDGESPTPPKMWTISHVAGWGFLYTVTGDKKYAELGKECMDQSFAGAKDANDSRYSFKVPDGALRAGPALGWGALGYDLLYDGWDAEYRQKVADAIQNYNAGQWRSLAELVRGERQHPGSNHWGMQVGGAALALLAVMNDPGIDMGKIEPLLKQSHKSMLINMTQGFGDGGFFVEGDGTGSMASHITFLPALQAWRTAYGKDYYTPRPNAQWMTMKWFFLTALGGNPANFRASFPERGAYPHNIWARNGISGGGYCSIGFGVATDEQKAAILWFYNHSGLKQWDEKMGFACDAASCYPHHAILAFVNWPRGMTERNPGGALPHAYRDSKMGFYAWRNRWQDAGDVIVSIQTKGVRGNFGCKAENALTVACGGKQIKWGAINGGFAGEYQPAKDGTTILVAGDGSSLAVDFSKASGADAMLVMTGPGAPAEGAVEAGGRKFSFRFFGSGEPPQPKAAGDKVTVGGQTVAFDGKRIVLGGSAK
jgi:hypothetical protein